MLHESGLEVLASIPGNADSHRHADDILNPLRQVAGDPNVAADLQFRVELRGFEPLTPSMRTRCATRLRYSPENLSQRSKLCRLLVPRTQLPRPGVKARMDGASGR